MHLSYKEKVAEIRAKHKITLANIKKQKKVYETGRQVAHWWKAGNSNRSTTLYLWEHSAVVTLNLCGSDILKDALPLALRHIRKVCEGWDYSVDSDNKKHSGELTFYYSKPGTQLRVDINYASSGSCTLESYTEEITRFRSVCDFKNDLPAGATGALAEPNGKGELANVFN
tara:strand:- start:8013 stop:8525 length:513 start_codon:yes stop_codon:yes gene_type:complete